MITQPFIDLERWARNSEDQFASVAGRLRPDEIADYHTGMVDDSCVIVVLKGGSSFAVAMPIAHFDNMLKLYYKYIDLHKKSLPVILTIEDLITVR